MIKTIKNHLHQLAADVDPRSLALWRIITGLAVIYDLIFYRFLYLDSYYSLNDLRPGSSIIPYFGENFYNIQYLGDSGILFFLIVCLITAVLYTAGIANRIVKPILFIMYTLLIMNSIYLVNGFHFIVLVSVFWSIFLPTNAVWTLTRKDSSNLVIHPLAISGLYLQIALIYFTSFLVKDNVLWMSGRAIELLINDEYYSSGLINHILEFPFLLLFLNFITLIWELLIPIFILFPSRFKLKALAAFMIVTLHIGISFVLQVGPFYLIGFAFAAVLIPKHLWNKYLPIANQTVFKSTSYFKTNIQLVKTFFLLVFIGLMIRGNMKNWVNYGHLSGILKQIPYHEKIIMRPLLPYNILYGFKHQPWLFFNVGTQDDLGKYIIIEEDEKGRVFVNGKQLANSVDELPDTFEKYPHHNLKLTDFIYFVNIKDYKQRFSQKTYAAILRRYANQEQSIQKNEISKLYLIHLKKRAIIDNDTIIYELQKDYLFEIDLNNLK